MSNKLALDALITALACLLPELHLENHVQFNAQKAFHVDNPNIFCNARNHINERFKQLEKLKEENERLLLKLHLETLQLEEQVSKNITQTSLHNHNCKGLKDGIYKLSSMGDAAPFYTFCEDENMLILQHFGANEIKKLTTEKAENGFGVLYDEFFIGLKHIFTLTQHEKYVAQVELKDANYETIYASYTDFKISKKSLKYKMEACGCRGDACDILGKPHKRLYVKSNCKDNESWCDFSCDANVFVKVYLRPGDSENCTRNKRIQ